MMSEKDAKPVVYIDGAFYGESDAKISVFDHALLYGDAIYETCCAWAGAIFKLDRHIDRLFESAHAVKLQLSLSRMALKYVVVETVRRSNFRNAYVKIIATRGVGEQPTLSPYNTDAQHHRLCLALPQPRGGRRGPEGDAHQGRLLAKDSRHMPAFEGEEHQLSQSRSDAHGGKRVRL